MLPAETIIGINWNWIFNGGMIFRPTWSKLIRDRNEQGDFPCWIPSNSFLKDARKDSLEYVGRNTFTNCVLVHNSNMEIQLKLYSEAMAVRSASNTKESIAFRSYPTNNYLQYLQFISLLGRYCQIFTIYVYIK